jgi:hypothetical protein
MSTAHGHTDASGAATYLALAVVSVDEIGKVAALVLEARAGLFAVVLIELQSACIIIRHLR